uniref:NADH dehydrogenase subunit 1 n=1 Tax=Sirsoe methanicola TaxID=378374 RepID=UPI0020371D11|nr:NADH dehydrogenase subunit 1 [Sirsoe methanicola]UQV94828.1 NADH dehydrogenase subunit 1 [Sirsoe methanicola]
MGIPQPLADALKLFTKELTSPTFANTYPFFFAPALGLFLALMLWPLFPHSSPSVFISYGILLFLCISSFNVYTTLIAGWASNSKYALLGALRSAAQTISYEVSMALILLSPLIMMYTLNLLEMFSTQLTPPVLMLPMLMMTWFTTTLAETNRTPFDFSEGESELVSGFNTEYSGGTFALIFMAEYMNIILMSLLTSALFFMIYSPMIIKDIVLISCTTIIAFTFLWARGTLPRMRYDLLMSLTWKTFLPFSLGTMLLILPMTMFI